MTCCTKKAVKAHESALNSSQRIGKRVRFFRSSKGYSQEKLSELCGVSPRYISELERGEANATINLLESVTNSLDIALEDIFENQHESSKEDVMAKLLDLLEHANDEQIKISYRLIRAIIK